MRIRSPQPQVWRVIEIVGLHRLPGVIVERRARRGLAAPRPRVEALEGLAQLLADLALAEDADHRAAQDRGGT